MRKYAQIFHGEVIYIIDSFASLSDLREHFSEDTVWLDITEMEDIEVGYIQVVDRDGRITFRRSIDNDFNSLDESEKINAMIYAAKVRRDKYLDELAQSKRYLDARDCFDYDYGIYSDGHKLKDLKFKLDQFILDRVPSLISLDAARDLDFEFEAKRLEFEW